MKREIREGKEIIVFDNMEEAKWHIHKKLCQNPCDALLHYILKLFTQENLTVAELNRWLKMPSVEEDEPCEVKEWV